MALLKSCFGQRFIFLNFILSMERVMLGKCLWRSSSGFGKMRETIGRLDFFSGCGCSHQPKGSGSLFSCLLRINYSKRRYQERWTGTQLASLLFLLDQLVQSFNPEKYVLLVTFSNFYINAMSEGKMLHLNAGSWRLCSLWLPQYKYCSSFVVLKLYGNRKKLVTFLFESLQQCCEDTVHI